MPHDFNNHCAAVAFCSSSDCFNTPGCNINCGVETKGFVCSNNIIINCLWHSDYIETRFRKQRSGRIGSVSAKTYKRIKLIFFESFFDSFNRQKSRFRIRHRILERLNTGSSKNRSSLRNQRLKINCVHLESIVIYEATVSVTNADKLHSIIILTRNTQSPDCSI